MSEFWLWVSLLSLLAWLCWGHSGSGRERKPELSAKQEFELTLKPWLPRSLCCTQSLAKDLGQVPLPSRDGNLGALVRWHRHAGFPGVWTAQVQPEISMATIKATKNCPESEVGMRVTAFVSWSHCRVHIQSKISSCHANPASLISSRYKNSYILAQWHKKKPKDMEKSAISSTSCQKFSQHNSHSGKLRVFRLLFQTSKIFLVCKWMYLPHTQKSCIAGNDHVVSICRK